MDFGSFEVDDLGRVCSAHNGWEPIPVSQQDRFLEALWPQKLDEREENEIA